MKLFFDTHTHTHTLFWLLPTLILSLRAFSPFPPSPSSSLSRLAPKSSSETVLPLAFHDSSATNHISPPPWSQHRTQIPACTLEIPRCSYVSYTCTTFQLLRPVWKVPVPPHEAALGPHRLTVTRNRRQTRPKFAASQSLNHSSTLFLLFHSPTLHYVRKNACRIS